MKNVKKVLRYTQIPTPLDDSTRPLDDSTNSTVHSPQRAGGPHGWVPVNTHSTAVLPKWEEAVGLHEPHHEGNGRSIHNKKENEKRKEENKKKKKKQEKITK